MFDVTSRASFESALRYWVPHVREHGADKLLVTLVGNKADLAGIRRVSAEEAQRSAADGGMVFIETSAKTGLGVEQVFRSIASRVPGVVAADCERTEAAGALTEGFRVTKVDGSETGASGQVRLKEARAAEQQYQGCC